MEKQSSSENNEREKIWVNPYDKSEANKSADANVRKQNKIRAKKLERVQPINQDRLTPTIHHPYFTDVVNILLLFND